MIKKYVYFLTISFFILATTDLFSQTKPIIINEHQGGGSRISKNINYNPAPLGGSCWQELDAQFINVSSDLYGLGGYPASYPLDDGSYGAVDLGWTFTFYGQTYSSLFVNVNGNVTFGNLHSAYSAKGFPNNSVPAMIAPFWGDVDLRGTGSGANKMYVKLEAGKISIQWVEVGYYNKKTNVTNTFQLILTDGNDPDVGIGKNAMFVYDDMNWCVGDASGGSNGFGNNVYATVGAQSAGGNEFYQIGLFGKDNSDYDGAGGNLDGVHYLDGRCFSMDLSQSNVPPIANNLPNNRTIALCPGMTYTLGSSFTAPELGQTTNTSVFNNTLNDFQYSSTAGNLSAQSITINPSIADTGTHYIAYEAQDDGTPSAITYDTLWVHIYDCGSEGSSTSLNFDGQDDYSVVHHHPALYSGGTNTYSTWIKPETQESADSIYIMQKEGQFKLGIIGSTLTPIAAIMINQTQYSVISTEVIAVNQWAHLCAVAETDTLKIYVNGALVGSSPIPGNIDVTNKPLYIGGKETSDNFFKGRLDELALISKSCNEMEVKQLRWELSSIDPIYLRAYFKCTSDVVLTNSTNPYHGTLVNMTDPNKWKNNYGKIWKGAVSSDFKTPQNWAEGLPPLTSEQGGIEADEFVIFDKVSENNHPLDLTSTQEVNTVVFTTNNNAVINSEGQLRVHKDMLSFKSPTHNGEVLFTGFEEQTIYGNNVFTDLKIDNDVKLLSDQTLKGSLTLATGKLTTNNFDFTVISSENGSGQIFHNSGSIIGEVIMERRMIYDSSALGWHYISSPISNLTVNDLQQDLQILGLGTTVESNPFPSFYYYNESVVDQNLIKGWEPPASSNSPLESFRGYIYHKYKKDEQKLQLKGEVFSGSISKYLTYTNSGLLSADGWHLLGNPYPSAINWDQVSTSNVMDNAMYIYDNKADVYQAYVDGIGINNATKVIPTMTSFFIHVNSPTTFTLDNNVRIADSDSKHYRTVQAPEFSLTIELVTGQTTDQTIIRTREGATVDFDSNYDAYKLLSSKGNNVYSKIGNQNLSINSVDEFSQGISIPIELTSKTGSFTLNLSTSSNWMDRYESILVSQNNQKHPLKEDMNFSISSASDPSRFYTLQITPKTLMTSTDKDNTHKSLQIVATTGQLTIKNAHNFTSYRLSNLEGKMLFSGTLDSFGTAVLSTSILRNSMQMVVLTLQGGEKVHTEKINLR